MFLDRGIAMKRNETNYKKFKNIFYGERWKKEDLIDYLVEDDYFEETKENLNRMTLEEIYEKYPEDCFDFLCDNQE